jgi:hypothetical protein
VDIVLTQLTNATNVGNASDRILLLSSIQSQIDTLDEFISELVEGIYIIVSLIIVCVKI